MLDRNQYKLSFLPAVMHSTKGGGYCPQCGHEVGNYSLARDLLERFDGLRKSVFNRKVGMGLLVTVLVGGAATGVGYLIRNESAEKSAQQRLWGGLCSCC